MFTGIIENLGIFISKNGSILHFKTDTSLLKRLDKGTSISVNGACLTILEKPVKKYFSVEVMPETLEKTMLGDLKINDIVNLELPVTPATFFSGHFVLGHIDGIGEIVKIEEKGNSKIYTFKLSKFLSKYLIEKGSIAINGISLTVIDVKNNQFSVGIIPFTLSNTMLKQSKTGDKVNIEIDMISKHILKFIKD